jgi:hypothetical protein
LWVLSSSQLSLTLKDKEVMLQSFLNWTRRSNPSQIGFQAFLEGKDSKPNNQGCENPTSFSACHNDAHELIGPSQLSLTWRKSHTLMLPNWTRRNILLRLVL